MNEPEYAFHPLTARDAEAVVTWRYQSPYDVYNLDAGTVSSLILPEYRYYAVRRGDEMIGFRCYGADAQVSGGDYSLHALDMGGGLRPDLTGRGLGASVVRAAMRFAIEQFHPDRFRVTVASFNERAIRTCVNAGFAPAGGLERPSDRNRFTILMKEVAE